MNGNARISEDCRMEVFINIGDRGGLVDAKTACRHVPVIGCQIYAGLEAFCGVCGTQVVEWVEISRTTLKANDASAQWTAGATIS